MTKTITEKYQASKTAITMIETNLPKLVAMRPTLKSTGQELQNFREAKNAFFQEIIAYVTENEIANYSTVIDARNNMEGKLGLMTGIKGWR
jgi:hypothetical protein